MATGWIKDKGKWYYLNLDGSMASNTIINGYRVDISGAWIKDISLVSDKLIEFIKTIEGFSPTVYKDIV